MAKKILTVSICLWLLVSTADSQTVTVYNNFGRDNGGWDYVPNFGWSVAGPNAKPPQYGIEQAMGFSPKRSGVVSDIWVAIFYMPNDPQYDEVTIKLTKNNNGLPPAQQDVIEEWTIVNFPPSGQWAQPQHITGNGNSFIEAGSSYWLWAEGGDTTWCGWSMNSRWSLTCPHTMRREGEGWTTIEDATAPAFRIDVKLDYGISTETTTISASTGGIVTFNLCAGKANGRRRYQLLGGMSGTSPGTPLPGALATLPLNLDSFSYYILRNTNTPNFQDFTGLLNPKAGSAQAYFDTLGPLPPNFAGKTLSFAFALTDSWDYASNAVDIQVVP